MFHLHSGFSLLLLAFAGIAWSQSPSNGTVVDSELYSIIQGQLQALNVTGASLAIVWADGRPVEYATWGARDEDGTAMTSDTLFNIGSCSKAFLSTSLGILMQDYASGKNTTALPGNMTQFDWYTTLHDLLPGEWLLQDPWATEKATMTDLLSHVTGLPSHDGAYNGSETPADIVAQMRHLRTSYELRQMFQYNNMMYMTGSYIVSKYSGMEYRDFVAERIFKRLGMNSSTLYPEMANATGRLTQTFSSLNGRRIPFFLTEESARLIAGAGGIESTVEDLSVWVRTLLNQGVDPRSNETIIPQPTFDLATSAISVLLPSGDANLTSIAGYGMGWARLSYRGYDMLWHTGGAPGVASRVEFYPSEGFGIALLTNGDSQTATEVVAYIIDDAVLGLSTLDFGNSSSTGSDSGSGQPDEQQPLPLAGFTGTFSNPGYGNFTLCSPLFSNSTACQASVAETRQAGQVDVCFSAFLGTLCQVLGLLKQIDTREKGSAQAQPS